MTKRILLALFTLCLALPLAAQQQTSPAPKPAGSDELTTVRKEIRDAERSLKELRVKEANLNLEAKKMDLETAKAGKDADKVAMLEEKVKQAQENLDMQTKILDTTDEIAKARDAGDNQKAEEMGKELQKAQQDFHTNQMLEGIADQVANLTHMKDKITAGLKNLSSGIDKAKQSNNTTEAQELKAKQTNGKKALAVIDQLLGISDKMKTAVQAGKKDAIESLMKQVDEKKKQLNDLMSAPKPAPKPAPVVTPAVTPAAAK